MRHCVTALSCFVAAALSSGSARAYVVQTLADGTPVRWAPGDVTVTADQASLEAVSKAFAGDTATVQDLMVAVATMRSFRSRSLSPGETP